MKEIDRHLHLLKVHLPYHESDHVLNIAYNALVGGQRLEDIELRRQDATFLNALGAQRLPDPTTAGDFTRRFRPSDIETLMDCINRVRTRIWKKRARGELKEALIDIDGTLATTLGERKQGMALCIPAKQIQWPVNHVFKSFASLAWGMTATGLGSMGGGEIFGNVPPSAVWIAGCQSAMPSRHTFCAATDVTISDQPFHLGRVNWSDLLVVFLVVPHWSYSGFVCGFRGGGVVSELFGPTAQMRRQRVAVLDSEKRGYLGHMIAVDHDHGRPAVDHRPCARRQSFGEFAGGRHRVARPDHEFLVPGVQNDDLRERGIHHKYGSAYSAFEFSARPQTPLLLNEHYRCHPRIPAWRCHEEIDSVIDETSKTRDRLLDEAGPSSLDVRG